MLRRRAAARRAPRRVWLERWAERGRTWRSRCCCVPVSGRLRFFGRRTDRVLAFRRDYRLTYLAAILESALVWGALLYAACRQRGWAASPVGGAVRRVRHVRDRRPDATSSSSTARTSIATFPSSRRTFARASSTSSSRTSATTCAPSSPSSLSRLRSCGSAGARFGPPRSPALVATVLAPLLLVGSFFVPTQYRHVQASTPDVLYLNSIGGLLATQLGFTEQSNQLRPRLRESLPVPPLSVAPGTPRSATSCS